MLKKLSNLNTDKSAGLDNLHPKVLFEVRHKISYPLHIIFNKSLFEGILPDDWKTAILSPIFKNNGDKKHGDAYIYHPISLTSVICKICESLINDKMMNHLIVNNLLSDSQYGFKPGRSCAIQLLEILDEWSILLDSSNPVDNIYLDFSRAFDSVPHERLITKLLQSWFSREIVGLDKLFLNRQISMRKN